MTHQLGVNVYNYLLIVCNSRALVMDSNSVCCFCRCNKLLSSEDAVQMHAARTGHSQFSESVEEIKPLMEEEKQAQLLK
jgi:hypothetical protein